MVRTFNPENTRVFVGPYEQVSSGIFFVTGDENARVEVKSSDRDIVVHFQFFSDDEGQRIAHTTVGGGELFLSFYNYDNPLGTYTARPAKFGDSLYFSYRVTGSKEHDSKVVEFAFYVRSGEDG